MTVKITQKKSPIFAVKVGIAIIAIFILLGLVFKMSKVFLKEDSQEQKQPHSFSYYSLDNPVFIPAIELSVEDPSLEKYWIEAFRQKINGRSEVPIENGRVDIVTDSYAIEVDYLHKWQEGLGQALHYGDVLSKIPTLALIDDDNRAKADHVDQLKYIEALCIKRGVKLLLLKNTKSK
ncbi:MAG: hypothetical protein OEW04_02795 [Nitrospirota bacterium]|nr:hypothetical protein [Nitrospirota bacterium]